jgi:hypothetical protein
MPGAAGNAVRLAKTNRGSGRYVRFATWLAGRQSLTRA